MTIGDLYTLNTNSDFDFVEIWTEGRLILDLTPMNSIHLAWYGWEIKHFFGIPKWEERAIKYIVIV